MSKSIAVKVRQIAAASPAIDWLAADPSVFSNFLGNLTVATLPAAATANKGYIAFATDARGVLSVDSVAGTRALQGAGTGTGALVVSNGTVWQIAGTLITAVA